MDGRAEIRWAPRVSKALIRRLYESDARGLLDEDLLDEIGTRLVLRCESILTASDAAGGRVRCPRCAGRGIETVIRRGRSDPDQVIECNACGWTVTWREYFRTYKRRQLTEGGAGKFIRGFLDRYPKAKTPAEKMLAIDRLIHEFHFNALRKGEPKVPTRAACVNFIEGRLTDVVAFLNDLSAGDGSERRKTREEWRKRIESIPSWHPR